MKFMSYLDLNISQSKYVLIVDENHRFCSTMKIQFCPPVHRFDLKMWFHKWNLHFGICSIVRWLTNCRRRRMARLRCLGPQRFVLAFSFFYVCSYTSNITNLGLLATVILLMTFLFEMAFILTFWYLATNLKTYHNQVTALPAVLRSRTS